MVVVSQGEWSCIIAVEISNDPYPELSTVLLLSVMMMNAFKHTKLNQHVCKISMFFLLFLSSFSLAKISRTIPDLNQSDWGKLDLEFGHKVSHIHHGSQMEIFLSAREPLKL